MPASSIQLAAEPQLVRRNLLGICSVSLLAALCVLNANYLTRALLGKDQVFSIIYFMAMVITMFAFRFRITKALGPPGLFWVLALLVYLAIATRMGAGIPTAYFLSPQSNLYRLLIAQGITVALALGARHIILLGKMQEALRVLFGLTVMAALTIILVKKFPGILQFVGHQTQDRSAGFFADANRAGQAVCVTASIGFACLVNETGRWKWAIYAGMLLLVPCLFLTYSRSSIIFMAVLVTLQFVISPVLKRKEMILAILALVIAMPIGVSVILNQRASADDVWDQANTEAKKERIESLFRIMSGNFDASDTGHRFVLAAVGIKYFMSNPVIGAGYRKLVKMEEVGAGCHNTFLRLAGEAGIFSVLMFIAAILFTCWSAWICGNPTVKCIVIGYLAMYSCSGMVSHSILTNRLHNVVMGVCIGLLSGALLLRKYEAKQKTLAQRRKDQAMVGLVKPTTLPAPQHATSV